MYEKGFVLKKFVILLFIILVLFVSTKKVFSYENFDGRYSYSEYDSNTNYQANLSNKDEEVLFIVDFSASMSKRMGYAPKAYHAIDAIRSILNDAGNSTKIGLRVFGISDKPYLEMDRDGYSYNKANICSASSLLLPVARYNNQNISDRLSTLTPQGATPIGYSLRQAVQNDFTPNASFKHIILITDGGENCGDDPCLFIKRLMQLRNDIRIDVIGITVDENAYSQLNCIASAAKGNYYSVNEPDDFNVKFKQAFNARPTVQIQTKQNVTPVVLPKNDGIKYKNFVFEFDN